MQDSKLWGPHPLVNFLDLWKSTLTLKHLLDAFGQSSGAHRSCVLGSQVQHGMLSGCNVKRGQIQVEEEKKIYIYIYKHSLRNFLHTVGRHRLGPEHVQISTPQTWPHPNTMRASGARALGGMFCNARATHTAKLCPKNTGAKTQKCWDKKSCAGSAGAKKVYAGHASHTLAHCFQEMSACMIADI